MRSLWDIVASGLIAAAGDVVLPRIGLANAVLLLPAVIGLRADMLYGDPRRSEALACLAAAVAAAVLIVMPAYYPWDPLGVAIGVSIGLVGYAAGFLVGRLLATLRLRTR